MHTGFWWGNLREGDHLEDPGIDWEDNIKMDLQEVGGGGGHGLDCFGTGYVQLVGCCKHGNEPLGSIKCKEFHD